MIATRIAVCSCLAASVVSCSSSKPHASTSSPGATPKFSASVTNKWFPLPPGRMLTYRGTKDGKPSKDIFVIQRATRVIDGAPCAVVSDRLYLSGKLAERTTDYYSQDAAGNVWYYGEDTAELDANGRVTSTEGSWRAGRDGARAGIYIDANPQVGRGYRQEYYKGHAEDRYETIQLAAAITVPAGSFSDAVVTKEWTALEPDVLDHKYYVAGIGVVAEISVSGPREVNKLVSVTRA